MAQYKEPKLQDVVAVLNPAADPITQMIKWGGAHHDHLDRLATTLKVEANYWTTPTQKIICELPRARY